MKKKFKEYWIFNRAGGVTQLIRNRPRISSGRWNHVVDYAALECEKKKVKGLAEALEYITSHKHFIGINKWDAEFVDVAELALKAYKSVDGLKPSPADPSKDQ